ncbi:MAG: RluA family pseudouridine synthase [Planctomycetota bacterium]|nr:RluA family pseudouridine synthase [Planctomycetota bacterium]
MDVRRDLPLLVPKELVPIIHATPRYVVVNKPAGLLSVPGIGPEKQDCVVSRVLAMFPSATGPMMVHRLDMETSGVMVVALDADAQRELSMQFESRVVMKTYVALLEGSPARDEGEIALPMRLDVERRPYQIVDFEQGKPAVTRYRVLSREVDRARVEFEPITGRTHQIRVHAASEISRGLPGGGLGSPIVGDGLYGINACGPGGPTSGLLLHARTLSFLEPGTTRRVEFEVGPGF